MPRPLKFPAKRMVRLSKETDKKLVAKAKVMGVGVSVAHRIIVEHSLSGEPIKENTDATEKRPDSKKIHD